MEKNEDWKTNLLIPSISSFLVKYLLPDLSTPASVRLRKNPAILANTLDISDSNSTVFHHYHHSRSSMTVLEVGKSKVYNLLRRTVIIVYWILKSRICSLARWCYETENLGFVTFVGFTFVLRPKRFRDPVRLSVIFELESPTLFQKWTELAPTEPKSPTSPLDKNTLNSSHDF